MPTTVRTLLAAVCLLVASCPSLAADTPEQVYQQSVEAVRQHGFAAMSDYMHPQELERFKGMLMPLFDNSGDVPGKEIARSFFGGDATPASIAAMPAVDFMKAVMGMIEGQLKGVDVRVGDSHVIGSVPEGEVVHLVTRTSVGAGALALTQMEVVSLRPFGDSWRLLLSGQMEGLAQVLKTRSAKPPAKGK